VVAARLQRSIGDALEAYAAGFEAMGRLSRSHRLYDGGWHPTAVCGAAGAAVAAARLLGADEATAVRLALLQAGGLRAAFG
jgi:2-methylcitrate dehydratase PrpD